MARRERSVPMRPFSQWYGGAELRLVGVEIPTEDFRKLAPLSVGKISVWLRDKNH